MCTNPFNWKRCFDLYFKPPLLESSDFRLTLESQAKRFQSKSHGLSPFQGIERLLLRLGESKIVAVLMLLYILQITASQRSTRQYPKCLRKSLSLLVMSLYLILG